MGLELQAIAGEGVELRVHGYSATTPAFLRRVLELARMRSSASASADMVEFVREAIAGQLRTEQQLLRSTGVRRRRVPADGIWPVVTRSIDTIATVWAVCVAERAGGSHGCGGEGHGDAECDGLAT
eukprot:scaffold4822_cov378-Prasinococcus_capsulatus_cf.AAC.3